MILLFARVTSIDTLRSHRKNADRDCTSGRKLCAEVDGHAWIRAGHENLKPRSALARAFLALHSVSSFNLGFFSQGAGAGRIHRNSVHPIMLQQGELQEDCPVPGADDGIKYREWTEIESSLRPENYFCRGLPGVVAPFGEFDPLGFSSGKTQDEVMYLREAELIHARIAMMALAGLVMQEIYHPMFPGIDGLAIKNVACLPIQAWQGIWGIAILSELKRVTAKNSQSYVPGGWFDIFDTQGAMSSDMFRSMQDRELSNGRLAMLALVAILRQEAVEGIGGGFQLAEFLHIPIMPGADFWSKPGSIPSTTAEEFLGQALSDTQLM